MLSILLLMEPEILKAVIQETDLGMQRQIRIMLLFLADINKLKNHLKTWINAVN